MIPQLGVASNSQLLWIFASQIIHGPPTATSGRQQEGVCRHPEITKVFVDLSISKASAQLKSGAKEDLSVAKLHK